MAPALRKPADEETIFARIDESLETIRQGLPKPGFVPAPLGREPQPTEALAEDVEPIIIRVEGSVHDQFGEAVLTEVQISGETNGQRTVEVFNTNSWQFPRHPALGGYLYRGYKHPRIPCSPTNHPGPEVIGRVKLDIELQKLEKSQPQPA